MGVFLLKALGPVNTGNHADGMVVVADDAAAARELASALTEGDFDWTDTNAASAATFVMAAPADYEGWRLSIVIRPDGGGFVKYSAEATGVATNAFTDVLDALITALTALGLHPSRVGLNLKVSSVADNIGDHIVTARVLAPGCEVPVRSFVSTITAQGAAGDELHVVYATPTNPPAVRLKLRQVQ